MSEILWAPQPGPQTELIRCPVFEVLYGGARGGGKTEGSIGDWLDHSGTYGEAAVGVFFRRKFKQLEEVVARTKQLFPKIGSKYNEQKAEWVMSNGARLKFRYIERDSDAQEYQGHNYTRVYVEEVTNFPTSAPIDLLRGTLRSATGVPVGLRLTGNPGGPGHHWVKARYITPDPRGWKILKEDFKGLTGEKITLERVFIPSKISDNALLWKNDPLYVARLRQAGSEALVRAWLEGNWDLVDGAFFDNWDEEHHVLDTRVWATRIPKYALRFRAFDWGYAKPFSCGWYAVSDGTWGLPNEAIVKYREWYGSDGKPNEGLRLAVDLVAQGIRSQEYNPVTKEWENVSFGVADPSIFIRDGGPSIAETMLANGLLWRRADNKRVPGWAEMRRRLNGVGGRPLLYFLSTCDDSIRTIPTLQVDPTNAEDLDTEGEDHAADETRYACMGRPWVEVDPETENALVLPKLPDQKTIMELIDDQRRRRLLAEQDAS
jgi:Terminase large subunit, T4likevirus-type, N-terminal